MLFKQVITIATFIAELLPLRLLTFMIVCSTLLFCRSVYCQHLPILGTWIMPTGKVIRIDSLNNDDWSPRAGISNLSGQDIYGNASISKDTLRITSVSFGTVNNQSVRKARVYGFLIRELTDSELVVAPFTKLARSYFPQQPVLHLRRQELSADTSLHFCQLYYHTTGCLGYCPTFHLFIDDQQNVQFYAENIIMFDSTGTQKDDTVRQGYYSGKLNDSLFKELVLAVQSSCLRSLTIPNVNGYDGAVSTIIVYFENERKYMQSMSPPLILDRLISTCYRICAEDKLPKTNRPLRFDD